MAALVTLDVAKAHLRITTEESDQDIYRKAEQASAIVLAHLNSAADPGWTPDTVPATVQTAVLLMLSRLYERLDDQAGEAAAMDVIDRVLVTYRKSALS